MEKEAITMSKVNEILMSAQYNLETVARQNPGLNQHPSYVIGMSQIKELVNETGKCEE